MGRPRQPRDEHGNPVLCVRCNASPIKRKGQRYCSRPCAMRSRPVPPLEERFRKFFTEGAPHECWRWTGATSSGGYGAIMEKYPHQLIAHRVAYQLAHGPIPPGMYICHACDNRWCVNPAHLFIGTSADNAHDRNTKDRQAKGRSFPNAKLTENDVLDIRALYPRMSQMAIAKRYGVHQSIISDVIRRETWKHV